MTSMLLSRAIARTVLLCAGVALSLASPVSSAASGHFATAAAKPGKFTVEYIYNYVERKYSPEISFSAVARKDASYASPEDAFISHFSAMTAGDYDWWISGWTPDSRASIEARNKRLSRSAKDWQVIWARALKDQRVKMVARVETGPYVFIVYKMFDKAGKLTMYSMYACKKEGDKWLATEELAEDLMFQHFLEKERRVSINVR